MNGFLLRFTYNVPSNEDKAACDNELNLCEMGEALKLFNDNSAAGTGRATAHDC